MTLFDFRIVSVFRSHVSWAKISRELAQALLRKGYRVCIEVDESEPYDPDFPLTNELKAIISKNEQPAKIDLLVVRPELFEKFGRSKIRLAIMVFEAPAWPVSWVRAAKDHIDLALVPSTFCRDGLISSGLPPAQVELLPHGIDQTIFNTEGKIYTQNKDLKVLFVGTPARRKGLDILLCAFEKAVSISPNLSLTIKTKAWPFREDAVNDLEQKFSDFRANKISFNWIPNFLSEEELSQLYQSHDVLCLPHRGEGFAMTCLESMACGTPVIATAWSGLLDYFDASVGWPMEEFHRCSSEGLFPDSFPDNKFASMVEPSTDELTTLLILLSRKTSGEILERKGIVASKRAGSLSWDDISTKMLGFIKILQSQSSASGQERRI